MISNPLGGPEIQPRLCPMALGSLATPVRGLIHKFGRMAKVYREPHCTAKQMAGIGGVMRAPILILPFMFNVNVNPKESFGPVKR